MLRHEYPKRGQRHGWLLTALILSACASDPGIELTEDADTRISTRIPGKSEQAFSDGLYLMLSAELAGQEGNLPLALNQYRQLMQLHPDALAASRCAQIALYLKQYPEAMESVNLWIKLAPGDLAARRLAVVTFLRNGKPREALSALLFIVDQHPAELETGLIDLIKALETDVEPADALQLMKGLAEARSGMPEAHLAFALVAGDQRQFSTALNEIERTLAIAPDNRRAQLLQVELLARTGNSPESRRILLEAIRKDPHNTRLHMVYSQYLAKSGDIEGARKQLETILAQDPKHRDARFGLALIDMETGHEESAYHILEKLAREGEGGAQQPPFYLGLLDLKRGHIDEAVAWFDKVNGGTLEYEARVNAITARLAQNQFADARARMANARSQYPKDALKFYVLEAEMLTRNHDYPGALDLLSEAIRSVPDQADLFYARALVADQLGHKEDAENDLRTVLSLKPEDPAAMNALGYTLADHNTHLEEAAELLQKALTLKPGDAAFEDSFGWLEFRREHYAEAEKYLRSAWEKTSDPEIGAHLVELLLHQEKIADARAIIAIMKGKDPSSEHLRRVLQSHPELSP